MKSYFKDPRFSASAAKILSSGLSPYSAFHKLRKGFKPTPAMQLGTLVHAIIEHGGVLPKSAAVASPYPAQTTGEAKAFTAWWNGDKDFLSKLPKKWSDEDQERLGQNIENALWAHEAGGILTDSATIAKAYTMAEALMEATDTRNGEHEKAYFTEHKKALVDFVTETTCKDWKTTSATTMKDVLRDCWKYGYDIQAAQYLELTGKDKFELVFVSSVEPHEVFIVEAGESFVATGKEKLDKAFELWMQYKDTPLEEIPKAEPATIEDSFRVEPAFEEFDLDI